MMTSNVMKFAVSGLALAVTMVGCKPAGTGSHVASASSKAAKGNAATLIANAQAAAHRGDLAGAVALAEKAVELAPEDAGYRMLLGESYLRSGRFQSAASAFTDVLSLDPGNSRAGLSVALANIARGDSRAAIAHLDAVLGWARELRVRQVYLVHMGNGLDYRTLAAELPDWAAPAHDGLEIAP